MGKVYDIFTMTDERENVLMNQALIIFDSSSISQLYLLVEEHKQKMMFIVQHLKSQMWVPAQVMYEYRKNIDSFRTNAHTMYSMGVPDSTKFMQAVDNYINKFSVPDYHPFIDEKAMKVIKEQNKSLINNIKAIQKTIKEEIKKRNGEIDKVKTKDIILDAISYLPQGEPFTFEETMQIIHEGEFRYRNQLPPGYMDAVNHDNQKPKKGIQKYGDLIIWKEIIRKAKQESRPVIFIIDDTKEDIYFEHTKGTDPTAPRHELLSEFNAATGQYIWFYTLRQFISLLIKHFKDSSQLNLFGGLDGVLDVLQRRALETAQKVPSKDYLTVKCRECGNVFKINASDILFEWERNSVDERSMGPESEYETYESYCCPKCGHQIDITFRVWEYPEGAFNNQEMLINNESVDCPINLSKYISFHNDDSL